MRRRMLIALAAGFVAGSLLYALTIRHPQFAGFDFTWHWRAARAILAGENPYVVIQDTGQYPYSARYLYPLPAALLAIPVAWLPVRVAAVVVIAVAAGVFGYAVSDPRTHQWPLLLAAPLVSAVVTAQPFPLLLAAAMTMPRLQLFLIGKPNIGAAVWARRPTWWAVGGGVVLAGVAFAVLPTWPLDWVNARRGEQGIHLVPLLVPGGVVLLLALLRWRTPNARLLLVMSLVPQTMTWYDPLPVLRVARTFRECLIVALISQIGFVASQQYEMRVVTDSSTLFTASAPFALCAVYIPALVLVLRRSREVESHDVAVRGGDPRVPRSGLGDVPAAGPAPAVHARRGG